MRREQWIKSVVQLHTNCDNRCRRALEKRVNFSLDSSVIIHSYSLYWRSWTKIELVPLESYCFFSEYLALFAEWHWKLRSSWQTQKNRRWKFKAYQLIDSGNVAFVVLRWNCLFFKRLHSDKKAIEWRCKKKTENE